MVTCSIEGSLDRNNVWGVPISKYIIIIYIYIYLIDICQPIKKRSFLLPWCIRLHPLTVHLIVWDLRSQSQVCSFPSPYPGFWPHLQLFNSANRMKLSSYEFKSDFCSVKSWLSLSHKNSLRIITSVPVANDDYADDIYGDNNDENRVTAGFNLSSSAEQISGWAHFLTQLMSSFNVGWLCYRADVTKHNTLFCFKTLH